MKITTHRKVSLALSTFTPESDAIIMLHDSSDRRIYQQPGTDIPILHLFVDDIKNEDMSMDERIYANLCKTERTTNWLYQYTTNGWPTQPMTPWHARQIIEFAYSIGFMRNIHVYCHYGRSRSVTVATFLNQFMFPAFNIEFSRNDARTNNRFHQLLEKE